MAKAPSCPQIDELEKLASGHLPPPRLEPLVQHLETCAACFAKVKTLSPTDTLMEVIAKAKPLAERAQEDLVARVIDKLTTAGRAATGKAKPITVACPSCRLSLKVKAELAGKKVKCPKCGSPVAVLPTAMGGEEPTLPPKNGAAKESVADADGQTSLGNLRKGETTVSSPENEAGQELYDFLAPAEQADEIGRLGQYRILKVLGAGGMGVVFEAEDPKLKRKVAIKAMLPALAASATAKQRFLREAQTAAAIEHDHIVAIYQVGEDRGVPFIAMPFLKGEPLDERLKRDKVLPLADVLRIGREVATGLGAAHAAGLVHRDIKPANIWLEALPGEPGASATGGRVKILDFGLARAAADNAQLTQQGAIIGTPAYMAPEQATGQAVNARCDLFSLGCVLYRLCTGELPFKGSDTVSTLVAVATDNPPPPIALRPQLPQKLSDLVMQLLEKDPGKRVASAEAVVEALRPITKASKGSKGSALDAAPARKTPKPLVLVVGGALVAAVLAGIVLFWQTPHGTVKIESDDPAVEIVFDKTGPTIKGADKEPISLRAGEHGILVKRGDFTFEADKVLIEKGKTITLKFELFPGKMQLMHDGNVIASRDIPLPKSFTNSLGMEFVLVPKGKSWLGGGGGRVGAKEVEIAHDFYLGKYEVTQEEWQQVMGNNPSWFSRTGAGKDAVRDIADADLKRFPVESVSWDDCQTFVRRLNEKVKEQGWVYRLPTEVEWEYACRGGPLADKSESAFDFYAGKPTNHLQPQQANFWHDQGLNRTCKVGSYPPNRRGLYDMHGNVGECCLDERSPENASAGYMGRGGSWHAGAIRAVFRGNHKSGPTNYRGLRVALVPVDMKPVALPPSAEKKITTPTLKNTLGMRFAFIPRGKFIMGTSPADIGRLMSNKKRPGKADRFKAEEPEHEVEITQPFSMGVHEVTVGQFRRFVDDSKYQVGDDRWQKPGWEQTDDHPVIFVTWNSAVDFCAWLSKKEGKSYRLPTEAEWEYCCRAGKAGARFSFGNNDNLDLGRHGWFQKKSAGTTHAVGLLKPNAWGLYDMHGNACEWVQDHYDPHYYKSSPKQNPVAKTGGERVVRGGAFDSGPYMCRSACRLHDVPGARGNIGFRVVLLTAPDEDQPPGGK